MRFQRPVLKDDGNVATQTRQIPLGEVSSVDVHPHQKLVIVNGLPYNNVMSVTHDMQAGLLIIVQMEMEEVEV